jgi:hypothetical protein
MLNVDPKGPLYRGVAVLAGICLIAFGLRPILSSGSLNYRNWFGGLVFAPLAIIFGLLVILAALFKPQLLQTTRKSR